jgi:hypothetical protein
LFENRIVVSLWSYFFRRRRRKAPQGAAKPPPQSRRFTPQLSYITAATAAGLH